MTSSNYVRLVVCSMATLALSAGSAFCQGLSASDPLYSPPSLMAGPWRVNDTATTLQNWKWGKATLTLKGMSGTAQCKVVKGRMTPQAANVIKTVVEMSPFQISTDKSFSFVGMAGQWTGSGSSVFFAATNSSGNLLVKMSPTGTVGVARMDVAVGDASGSNVLLVTVNMKLTAVN